MSEHFIMKTDPDQFRSQVFTSGMTHLDLDTCYTLHLHKIELKIPNHFIYKKMQVELSPFDNVK